MHQSAAFATFAANWVMIPLRVAERNEKKPPFPKATDEMPFEGMPPMAKAGRGLGSSVLTFQTRLLDLLKAKKTPKQKRAKTPKLTLDHRDDDGEQPSSEPAAEEPPADGIDDPSPADGIDDLPSGDTDGDDDDSEDEDLGGTRVVKKTRLNTRRGVRAHPRQGCRLHPWGVAVGGEREQARHGGERRRRRGRRRQPAAGGGEPQAPRAGAEAQGARGARAPAGRPPAAGPQTRPRRRRRGGSARRRRAQAPARAAHQGAEQARVRAGG